MFGALADTLSSVVWSDQAREVQKQRSRDMYLIPACHVVNFTVA